MLVNTTRQVTQRAVAVQEVAAPVDDSLVAVMADHLEQEQQDKVIMVQAAVSIGIQEVAGVQVQQHHKQAAKSAMVV